MNAFDNFITDEVRAVLAVLTKLQSPHHPRPQYKSGICAEVQRLFKMGPAPKMLFSHWKHYSGNPGFPVPHPSWPRAPGKAEDAFDCMRTWGAGKEWRAHYKSANQKYIELRHDLLNWLVKEATQFLVDNP